MRALFLNQFYAPDIAATAQVLSALCQGLAARGHDIGVLCSGLRYRQPHHGFAHSPASDGGSLAEKETLAGVRVHRVSLPAAAPDASNRPAAAAWRRLADRAWREARFTFSAWLRLRRLVKEQQTEVLVAMSTPPTLLLLALAVGLPRRIPVVFWVQDVYPDLLSATGMLCLDRRLDRAAMAALRLAAAGLYRRTDAAVVLDEAMRDRLIAAGFPAHRLHVIDHAADSQAIAAVPAAENRIRRLLGLQPQDFVVCYAGNLGRGHDFSTVAGALPAISVDPLLQSVHFVFIGDGEGRAGLRSAVPAALSDRVHFLPPQEAALHRDVLSTGDVALVTLGAEFAGLMTPSKIYPLLAAARSILYVGPALGRVHDLCAGGPDRSPVGVAVENGDVDGFVAALRHLYTDVNSRQGMAQQARQLAEVRFDQRVATLRHEALLQRVIGDRAATVQRALRGWLGRLRPRTT